MVAASSSTPFHQTECFFESGPLGFRMGPESAPQAPRTFYFPSQSGLRVQAHYSKPLCGPQAHARNTSSFFIRRRCQDRSDAGLPKRTKDDLQFITSQVVVMVAVVVVVVVVAAAVVV